MDEIDQVQTAVNRFHDDALAQHQRHREPDNNAGTECIDCSEEIPLKRRQARPGCHRCIDCQELFEIQLHGGVS